MILVDTSDVVPVSVTGKFCSMNCSHCGGIYLKHMVDVGDMERFARSGRKVFLISGGMLPSGEIPFTPHERTLRKLKEDYSLRYNFHIGFPESVPRIVDELADVISADFFSDPAVMKRVYGISREPKEILRVLKGFSKPVVPHLTIGIACGELTHESKSLEMLSGLFEGIVLNVFVPTPGTEYSRCPKPDLGDVVRIFEKARKLFECVFLGCMQPRGTYRKRLQELLIDLVDGLVKPVVERGEKVRDCCAFQVIG